jgi:hypothetical protein
MPETAAPASWATRAVRPARGSWVLLNAITVLGLIGIVSGALGPAWYILTPWLNAIVFFSYNVLAPLDSERNERRRRRARSPS